MTSISRGLTPAFSCLFSALGFASQCGIVPKPASPGSCLRCRPPVQISEFPTPAEIRKLPGFTPARHVSSLVLLDLAVLLFFCYLIQKVRSSENSTCAPWRAAGHQTRWLLDGKHVLSLRASCTQTVAQAQKVSALAAHQSRARPAPIARPVSIRRHKKPQSRTGTSSQLQMESS